MPQRETLRTVNREGSFSEAPDEPSFSKCEEYSWPCAAAGSHSIHSQSHFVISLMSLCHTTLFINFVLLILKMITREVRSCQ